VRFKLGPAPTVVAGDHSPGLRPQLDGPGVWNSPAAVLSAVCVGRSLMSTAICVNLTPMALLSRSGWASTSSTVAVDEMPSGLIPNQPGDLIVSSGGPTTLIALEATNHAGLDRVGKIWVSRVGTAVLLIGLTACAGGTAATAAPAAVSVAGQLAQISGPSLLVTDSQSRDTAITYDTSTVIETSIAAAIADVVPGECVAGSGSKSSSGQLSVRTLQVSPPAGGKCLTAPGVGLGRGPTSPRASGASPNPARSAGGQPNIAQISGLVTAVNGGLVTVKSSSGAVSDAIFAPTVRVTKLVAVPSSDLKVGDCLLARGSKGTSSEVKADTISVSQPGALGCFGGGRGPQRRGPSPSPTA
jgi:hypothetical protein